MTRCFSTPRLAAHHWEDWDGAGGKDVWSLQDEVLNRERALDFLKGRTASPADVDDGAAVSVVYFEQRTDNWIPISATLYDLKPGRPIQAGL